MMTNNLAIRPERRSAGPRAIIALATLAMLAFSLVSTSVRAAGLPDFESLVKQYGPAVVKITVTANTPARHSGKQPEFNGQDLPEFLRKFYENAPRAQRPPENPGMGFGSGFVMSADGYVVTNAHVVNNAAEIVVSFPDRREYKAALVGADDRTDIALLKIDAEGLPTLKLGDSSAVNVGQWVLAIGSPFGFEYTATQGIVSALSRSLPDGNYVPFIQTDVAVNPGNSGGPLFNTDGQVIGVNSQIYSRSGGYMGLSFAIPANVVKTVTAQLKTKGYVSRGWLGVLIQNVDQTLAESFGMQRPQGALVSRVSAKSPASEAGVKTGDIILSFNDQKIVRSSDLPPMVGATVIGEATNMQVLRGGDKITLSVTVAELSEDREVVASRLNLPDRDENRLGLTTAPMNDAQREQSGVADGGVIVTAVVPGGVAAVAGIREGDVVLSFNQNNVGSPAELAQLAADAPAGKPVAMLLQRAKNPLFTALTLPTG